MTPSMTTVRSEDREQAAPPEPLPLVRRWRGLCADLAPWKNRDDRRVRFQLLGLGLRGALPLAVGLLVGGWVAIALLLLTGGIYSGREAFTAVLAITGAASWLMGLNLFRSDQRQGTLELLWLGFGSAGKLVAYRGSVASILLVACTMAWILLLWWFSGGELALVSGVIVAAISALFALTLCLWCQSLLRRTLAGAALAAALLVATFIVLGASNSLLNPWINPFGGPGNLLVGGGAFEARVPGGVVLVFNRLLMLALALLMLRATARRLHGLLTD